MPEEVLIKKYPNRRLYDTEKSAYVSLEDVTEMIRDGRQVKVIEAKTGDDLTAFILTQIVLEEAKKNNALLPVPFLHLVVQYGENILAEFFEKYLQQTIDLYLASRIAFDEQFKNLLDLGFDFSAMANKTFTDFPPFNSMLNLFTSAGVSEKKQNPAR